MNRALALGALGLWAAVGCAAHNQELERKVDDLARGQRDTQELEKKLVELTAKLITSESERLTLSAKLDQLQAKLDKLAQAPVPAAPRPQRPEFDRNTTYAVAIAPHDPIAGPADARVTLVEAYDYACPYSEKSRDVLAELRQKYGSELRIVYKSFVVHPQVAMTNALAACAANKQHRFAELDTLLWERGFKAHNFDKDDPSGTKCWDSAAGCPIALGYAQELGFDVGRFQHDMQGCKALVDREMLDLGTIGVGATPTFFINGRHLAGAMPAADFAKVIDEELAKATDRIKHGASAKTYYQQWIVEKGEKTLAKP